MYIAADGGLVVSPTDLINFLACRHLTRLDVAVAEGRLPAPVGESGELEVLRARGLQHEHAYLGRLFAEGRSIARIEPGQDLRAAEHRTVQAMRAGVDVIYQATFFDGRWRGHADFLQKRPDRRSDLGDWSYDIADTKLARRMKVAALLQMATYGERLAVLQGRPPEWLVVVTGDGLRRPYRFEDCSAYARRVRRDLLDWVAGGAPTYPDKVAHCSRCRWDGRCSAQRRADDHLCLVAGLRGDHARWLAAVGVRTTGQLAAADPELLPMAISAATRERLVHQARLQTAQRHSGRPTFDLLPPQPRRGLARLPEPSRGDLFLDLEGDPYVAAEGFEYLFGLCDSDGQFTAYWARIPAQEKRAFEQAVDHLMAAWATDPGMHVYHYAPYETAALRRLSARYNTRVEQVDRMLRAGRLVDLYAVVRQALRAGTESYSIKKLEAFYDPDRRAGAEVADAASSIVAFERWLATGDVSQLDAIERYNESDCRSTLRLRDWLEHQRGVLVRAGGAIQRPTEHDGAPSEHAAAVTAASRRLYQQLTADLPADRGGDDTTGRATRLLADLLDWHRREARPEWWEYYRRLELPDDDLVDDSAAVGQLGPPVAVRTERQSTIWRMVFPAQDTSLRVGAAGYVDPYTERPQGTVVAIDAERGWLELRRLTRSGPPSCPSLVPGGPIDDRVQREALRRLAEWTQRHGVDADLPAHRAARDLLLRRPPRGVPAGPLVRAGESPAGAVVRLAPALSGGLLAVQGPPGSGKTWAAARAVVELVVAGQRVGLAGFSHKAISNLLDAVVAAAAERGVELRAMQKADGEDRCQSGSVLHTADSRSIVEALDRRAVDVVAGTAWLFARADLAGALDSLVVDEAGQLSLANVMAICGCARNLILVGDPRQLAQPAKGDHPAGAGASALEHVLGGAPTLPPDLGIFLDRTRRMHPAICTYVSAVGYEDRLHPDPACSGQRVDAGLLRGAGLRWVPVEHHGERSASTAEADVVAELYADLLRGDWTDAAGIRRPLSTADVLVVAPYNAHVGRVRRRLPSGARVGTVDRFQGQEAAVVIYTLATSTAADAPRGIEFLFSLNRLNVAISRARALAVVVASPLLLDAPVRTPDQLRMVNALCRLVEMADRLAVPYRRQPAMPRRC